MFEGRRRASSSFPVASACSMSLRVATLIQTGKVLNFPVVLVGRDHWQEPLAGPNGDLLTEGLISPEDVESPRHRQPREAVRIIVASYEERAGGSSSRAGKLTPSSAQSFQAREVARDLVVPPWSAKST